MQKRVGIATARLIYGDIAFVAELPAVWLDVHDGPLFSGADLTKLEIAAARYVVVHELRESDYQRAVRDALGISSYGAAETLGVTREVYWKWHATPGWSPHGEKREIRLEVHVTKAFGR